MARRSPRRQLSRNPTKRGSSTVFVGSMGQTTYFRLSKLLSNSRMMERSPWPVRSATFGSTSIVSVINMTRKNYTSGKTLKREHTTTTNSFAHDVERRRKRRSRPKQQRAKRKETARRRNTNGRLIAPSMRDARFGRRRKRRKSGRNGRRRRDWRCRMLLSRLQR